MFVFCSKGLLKFVTFLFFTYFCFTFKLYKFYIHYITLGSFLKKETVIVALICFSLSTSILLLLLLVY